MGRRAVCQRGQDLMLREENNNEALWRSNAEFAQAAPL
jgi:hypothetical protein